jgi:hypothetical protein
LGDSRLVEQTDARVDNCGVDLSAIAIVVSHCHLEREKLFGVASQLNNLFQNLSHVASNLILIGLILQSQINFDKGL